MINRIVFIGNDSSILTGVNGDARERMRLIASRFEKLTIILFTLKEDNLKPLKEKNLEIIPTNSSNRWHFVFDALKILSQHPDHDLISTQDPFIAGLVGVLAKFLWHKKLNIQIHNDFFGSPYFRKENVQNYIFYWLGKVNIIFADSIRVVSSRQRIGKNCFVAPVAADMDFFWAPPHTKKYNQIVCVARLVKQKNLKMLTDVADKLSLNLIIVGEGPERKDLPAKYLVGQKSPKEIKDIFKKSDVFVLPSNYEGWGLVCLEALAAGLPVVMTDTGCAGELVIDGRIGGFVASQGDQEKIIQAIKKLYREEKLRKNLVMSGQKNLFENYSQKKIIDQFVSGLKQTQ